MNRQATAFSTNCVLDNQSRCCVASPVRAGMARGPYPHLLVPLIRFPLGPLLNVMSLACLFMRVRQAHPASAATSGTPGARYALEVRSENDSSQATLSDNSEVTVGAFRVKMQDGQITVNKRNYGKLKEGDSVLIQSDGQVLVNLQIREPWDK